MSDASLELLKELCLAHGAPSDEGEVRDIFIKHLSSTGEIQKDRLGGVLCSLKEPVAGAPRVLIAGHMDEVAFAVQNITSDGFLQIVALGGWWTHNLLSQKLSLKTRSGKKILGVVTSTPPHLLSADARNSVLPIDKLYIDLGAPSKEFVENELGVSLGDTLVPVSSFETLADPQLLMAKAFDNRVGMASSIQSLKNIASLKLPCRAMACGTVQEEVGLRGAKTMAQLAKPDLVLVMEGPPADDTPGMDKSASQGKLGAGVQIRVLDPSAISNRKLVHHVTDVAKAKKIPYQVTVRRSGGTDAGSFHLADLGVPTIVLGVPARYIHTHNAVIHSQDYFAALKLVEELVQTFDRQTVDSFFA
jgi:putative aminopeptidase FrvX